MSKHLPVFLDLREVPGTGGAAPSQPQFLLHPSKAHKGAAARLGGCGIPGAQEYDGKLGRSHILTTVNAQTIPHVAVTFRLWHMCTGITESKEISWLGQAWLSAKQFSPAAFNAIYDSLSIPKPDGFWTDLPIAPPFQNTTIPPQPSTEWL